MLSTRKASGLYTGPGSAREEWPENLHDDDRDNPAQDTHGDADLYIIVECKVAGAKDQGIWRSGHWRSKGHGRCNAQGHKHRLRVASDVLGNGNADRCEEGCGGGVTHELGKHVGNEEQHGAKNVGVRAGAHEAY